MGYQAGHYLPSLAFEFQIYAGIEVHIADPSPHGHRHPPLRRIIPNEVRDHRIQPAKRFEAGIGVRSREGDLDVHYFPWLFFLFSEGEKAAFFPGLRGLPWFHQSDPYGVRGDPQGLPTSPNLEKCPRIELSYILDEKGHTHKGKTREQEDKKA
jgi:hypothetical protein